MLIEIPNYNLDKANIVIAESLVRDRPNLSRDDYAKELGINVRTLYRMLKDSKLLIPRGGIGIASAIAKLEKAGYTVTK